MRHHPFLGLALALAAAGLAAAGCYPENGSSRKGTESTRGEAAPAPAARKAELGKNVYLETEGDRRRVLVNAQVCLRQGQLELFLTRKRTKEHEAVLAADVDAKHIHAALLAARAEPGNPVRFRPKYTPASGTPVKVSVQYEDRGKTVRAPAQSWVRNLKTRKDLGVDWVFGGSRFIPDPLDKTKTPFYAANDGDLICVSNFETAMLDLPVSSSASADDLLFEANTERIPPVETPVLVILEPVLGGEKK